VRPVNLIPAEQRRGSKAPLRTGALGYVIVGVLAVALLGVTFVVLIGNKISDRKAEVATLQTQVAQAQARAQQLSRYEQFASLQQARQDTVSSLAKSRFDWERVLRELAIVIPSDVWLTDVIGSASGDSSSGSTTSSGTSDIQGPSLDMQGCASSHDAVASFLASLRDIDGVTRATVMSSDAQDASGGSATSSAGSTGSTAAGGTCDSTSRVVSFHIVAAFDNASSAAASTSPSSSSDSATTATSTPSTSSQVSDGVQQLNQQTKSAAQQTDKAQKAAGTSSTFVPGTGSTP